MAIKKILVTGSSGTIGTRLCEKLLERGYDLVGVDRKPNRWSEKVSKVTVIGDLVDTHTLENLPKNFDIVMHLAANVRIYNSVLDPELARENIHTVFNTLEFCRKHRVKRFFFASSREVYGNTDELVRSEDQMRVRNCESPYSASKISGEALVYAYEKCYGIDFVIVRFSNVYGMYDESDRVVPVFIKQTKGNRELVVYGKEKELDFTYIDDAVSGVVKCVDGFERAKNDVYNLASGDATTIVDVAEHIRRIMGGKNRIKVKENRTGEVVRYAGDISNAAEKLGYRPITGIEEGLEKSVRWYTENLYA
ncbi:MAG: NAD-dependent epimerase/dehydratase family protein [Candidatus Micrarchaeota archaeon]